MTCTCGLKSHLTLSMCGGREPLPRLSFRDVLEIHNRVLDRFVGADLDLVHLAHAAAADLPILGENDLSLVRRAPLEDHLALDRAPLAHGHGLVRLSWGEPGGHQDGDRERRYHSGTLHHPPLLSVMRPDQR